MDARLLEGHRARPEGHGALDCRSVRTTRFLSALCRLHLARVEPDRVACACASKRGPRVETPLPLCLDRYALLGQQLGKQITAGPGVPPASAAAVKDGDVLSADASGVVPRRKASGKRSKLPQGLPPPLPPDIDPMPPPSNVPRVVPRVVPMQSADGVATSRPPAPGDARSSAPTSDRKSDGGSRRNSYDKKSDGGSRRHSYDKDSLPGRLAQMLRRLEPQKVSRPATPAPAPLEEPRLAPSQGTGALFDPSQAPHRQARWVGAQQVPTLRPQQQLDEASAPASLTLASLDSNVPMGPQTANHDAPKPKVRRTRSFQLVRRLIRGGSQPSRPPIVPQPPPERTPDDESLRLQQFAISPCVTPPSTPSRKARLEASGIAPGSLKRPESEAPPIRRTISFQTTLKRAVGLQRAGPRDSQMPRAAEPTATASSRSAFFAPISPTPQCVTPPSTPSRKAREDAAGETADMQGISETEPEAPETETESEVPPLRRTQSFQATLRRVVGLRKEAQRETAASRYANGTTIPHVGLHDHRAPRP